VHLRQIEIDGPSQAALDARSVVLGLLPQPPEDDAGADKPSSPVFVWQGSVRSQSNAGRSYFIVIYDDNTARCWTSISAERSKKTAATRANTSESPGHN
jgi:hypothetical protein